MAELSCPHQDKCEINTIQKSAQSQSHFSKFSLRQQKFSITRNTTVGGLFFRGRKWLTQPPTMPTFRLADYGRALTRGLVYHRVLQSHHHGLRGASSGSTTPSVFITSLPERKGEGCHGQMHCNLLC